MTHSNKSVFAIAIAGMLSLGVAMGIGRFAFTPLMPMMLHEHLIDLPQASWLASANYLGYFLGAVLCTLQPHFWSRWHLPPLISSRMVRGGLIATALLTTLMATDWAAGWAWLRFSAGIVTAVAFVHISSWSLAHLAKLNAPSAGGIIYAGPGFGILISGLLASAMVTMGWSAARGWLAFGALSAITTMIVWKHIDGGNAAVSSVHATQSLQPPSGSFIEKTGLTIAYGFAGFGYIITATFLPVIARSALPGSVWTDFFWPILGAGVAMGALLASRIPAHIDQRFLLIVCYLMQAAGVVLGNWLPTRTGFAIGSVLVGLPFTAITFFVMQLGRKLHPQSASAMIGLLSASFALCQIAGPAVAALLLSYAPNTADGFAWALYLAAATLVAGALIYLMMIRAFPDKVKGS